MKNKSNLSAELSRLFSQKPNRKLFGIPRQRFYYVARDTAGERKYVKNFKRFNAKTVGEEPALLDTAQVAATGRSMLVYLQNRGHFFATVRSEITLNPKETKAKVTYFAKPGNQFTIDTLIHISSDTAIQRLLLALAKESPLQKGQPVDVQLYDQEVGRITRYLRNHGYAYFYPQYITSLEAYDSSNVKRTASLKLEVLTPPGNERHQSYNIGNIYIFPDFDAATQLGAQPDTVVQGLFFATGGKPFRVKPRTLANSIYFRTGESYSQEKIDNSIRQLGVLGVFRPPTLRLDLDTANGGVLNVYLYLTPNKKWEIGADFDISTTERTGVVANRNLIGLNFSPSLRNRNFLKGAELLITNMNAGIELALFTGDKTLVNALDFRLQSELYFPRFVDYLGLWKGMNKIGLTGDKFYQGLRQRSSSRFSAGYNLLVLLGNYRLQFFNTSFGFDVPVTPNHRVQVNHFGVDLVIPQVQAGSRFDSLLTLTPSLRNSFSRQFITGFLFRDLNFVYTSPQGRLGSSWYFRSYFDISGLEVMLANTIYNEFSRKDKTFNFFTVDFSHYAKLELDGRRYWTFGQNRSLVARINPGVALPYYRSASVPFIKQFYVGGPYSVRGWYARELGPGLYRDNTSNRNLFYQSGDLKLEFNLEYRFLLARPLGLFNIYGATFLDGGNIWTKDVDAARPGSVFSLRRSVEDGVITKDLFARELALAAGFGTRYDFTYFVLRLDFGTPVRNNYPDAARQNRYWVDFSKWSLNRVRYQLALGYPF